MARQRDAAFAAAMQAQAMSQIQGVLANDVRHPDGRPLSTVERIAVAERTLTQHYRATPWLVSALITDLSTRLHQVGDFVAERGMLARATRIARDADQPAQLANAECRRAASFAFEDLIDSARVAISQAKQALSRPGVGDDRVIAAACLTAEGKYLVAAGQRDSGITLLRRALVLSRDDLDNTFRLQVMNDLAAVLREGGRTREAIPYQMRVIAELDSMGHRDTDEIPAIMGFLTSSLAELGEYVVADSAIDRRCARTRPRTAAAACRCRWRSCAAAPCSASARSIPPTPGLPVHCATPRSMARSSPRTSSPRP